MSIAVEAMLKGGTYIWGAPTYDQVFTGFEETQRALRGVARFNTARMSATLPGGGRILYRSLDNPDNARSKTADGIVIDEAGDVAPGAWSEVLRPMMIDTGGWAWIVGTPKGRNWFYQGHLAAQTDPQSMTWQVPTLGVRITERGLVRDPHPYENPDIPFEEILSTYESTPERIFQQEYLAAFIDDAGGVFRGVSAVSTATPQEPQPGRQYVMGIDWAFSNDFTAIAVIDVADMRQVYMDRYNGVDYTLQRQRIEALAARYQPAAIISEANSMGRPNNEQLRAAGLPVRDFTTANATKAAVIESLAALIERAAITLLSDPVQVAELQAYEGSRLASGATRYSAPDGMHDDTVIALALAVEACRNTEPEVIANPFYS
jgi:hypothetical protein